MSSIMDRIEHAWQARREGRHADAERDLLRVIDESRNAGLRSELIHALKALAHVVRDQEQVDRALALYEEALALCREKGDALLVAHTVRHLGDLHREGGRIALAERCYEEALAIYGNASDAPPLDFANALRPAAILKEMEGEVELARDLWEEALRYYEKAGVQEGIREAEKRLGR